MALLGLFKSAGNGIAIGPLLDWQAESAGQLSLDAGSSSCCGFGRIGAFLGLNSATRS